MHCIVIGGGIMGLMTAKELHRAGCQVTVVERGCIGQEASWAGGGVASPLYPWRVPACLHPLLQWSQRNYPSFCRELATQTGIDPEWYPCGMLVLDEIQKDEVTRWSVQTSTRIEFVDRNQVSQIQADLFLPHEGGWWLPDVGQIRSPRLLKALRFSLDNARVQLREHTAAESLLVSAGKVSGVATDQGEIHGDCVVITAGAWSQHLVYATGLDLAITPIRGQMLQLRSQGEILQRIVLHKGCYMIPRRDGVVLVGSTLEDVGFDKSITADARERLFTVAQGLLPSIKEDTIERQWAGLRPGTPEGIPFIGQHPQLDNLYINAGHFRNGLALAPASARLIVDLMLEQPSLFDVKPFSNMSRYLLKGPRHHYTSHTHFMPE